MQKDVQTSTIHPSTSIDQDARGFGVSIPVQSLVDLLRQSGHQRLVQIDIVLGGGVAVEVDQGSEVANTLLNQDVTLVMTSTDALTSTLKFVLFNDAALMQPGTLRDD